ncbi:hypothetical protein PV11_03600 [Exophiala sideris]|uniref:Uncharacterized protein n=1 Tax=Exophiala sideris TaxID=1016849 RepID=A0A0D1VYE9_9EURO|nr:hypothetical protein PV11_03600 [Exophiala sideris]
MEQVKGYRGRILGHAAIQYSTNQLFTLRENGLLRHVASMVDDDRVVELNLLDRWIRELSRDSSDA